ncbi:hypothetical protein QAD02_017184 [Eretmocerus hayati]|uniref:Uncharacterized protein n=1 Tax=Eretmocerus hayati TaxID=131215 RepID=A0ACC2PDJ5_9HYME|nr:hypothetical protein QAD02_017184 [Eretmocerus hayati]
MEGSSEDLEVVDILESTSMRYPDTTVAEESATRIQTSRCAILALLIDETRSLISEAYNSYGSEVSQAAPDEVEAFYLSAHGATQLLEAAPGSVLESTSDERY